MHTVIIYVDDLMTRGRIEEAARGSSVQLRSASNVHQLVELCQEHGPRLVLADLDSSRLGALEDVRSLRERAQADCPEILGFVSHINGARATEARAAGFTRVLARRALVKQLPGILTADPSARP